MTIHNGVSAECVGFTQTNEHVVIEIRLPTTSPIKQNELIDDTFKVLFADGSKLTLFLYDDVETQNSSGAMDSSVVKLKLAKKHNWYWSDWGSMVYSAPAQGNQQESACPSSTCTPPDSASDYASSGSDDTDGHDAVARSKPIAMPTASRCTNSRGPQAQRTSHSVYVGSLAAAGSGSLVGTNGIGKQMGLTRAAVKDRDTLVRPGRTGLVNTGNTCYLNSVVQCLSHTRVLRHLFLGPGYLPRDASDNPLSYGGRLAKRFAVLLSQLWSGDNQRLSPRLLQATVAMKCKQFGTTDQQDAQEFLSVLLDGLHEDLNRVRAKPLTPPVEANGRRDEVVAAESWQMHRLRNDSFVVDNLQGQFKSKLVCPTCKTVSIIFDPFMSLSVPISKPKIRVCVYFVPRKIGSLPIRYDVMASEGSFVSGVTAAVSKETGLSADALYVFRPQHGVASSDPNQPLDLRRPSLSPFFVAYELLLESGDKEVVQIPMMQRLFQPPLPSSCHTCYNRNEPEKLLRCTKCSRVAYCNKRCQLAHWRVHSVTCKKQMSPCGVTAMITLPRCQVTYQSLSVWAKHYASLSVDTVHRDKPGAPAPARFPLTSSRGSSITSTASLGSNSSSGSSTASLRSNSSSASISSDGSTTSTSSSSGPSNTADLSDASTPASAGFNRQAVTGSSSSASSPTVNADQKRAALSSSSSEMVAQAAPLLPAFHLSIVDPEKGETGTSPGTRMDRSCEDVIRLGGSHVYVTVDWRNAPNHKDAVDVTARQDMRCCEQQAQLQGRNLSSQPCVLSIQDCLHKFIEPEILEKSQEWYCPKCKGHKQAAKQISVWKLPDTIVIHLKRFNKLLHKLNDRVSFPLTGLSLAESCTPGSPELRADDSGLDRTLYDLYAVSNHSGVAGAGHYTAVCREESDNIEVALDDPGMWLKFDDEAVYTVAPAKVVSPEAYLLFYRRRHVRHSPPAAARR